MTESNIQIIGNIICTELRDADGMVIAKVSTDEIRDRVSYWDYRSLNSWMPFVFSAIQRNQMTLEQEAQCHEHEIEGKLGMWGVNPDLKPMPISAFLETVDQAESVFKESYDEKQDVIQEHERTEKSAISDDDVRDKVINAPYHSKIILTAPPGTGKTHTLIYRICSLLEKGAIENPFQEMVVLSFTRAAVSEIVKRVQERAEHGEQDDLRLVNVRTFDSFTTHVLSEDMNYEQMPRGYDERKDLFARSLSSGLLGPNATEVMNRIKVLIVDEIQDLVGVKAKLVLEIARKVVSNGGGITLFGDPAQSIYDYEVEDNTGLTSKEFMHEAKKILGSDLIQEELFIYHRYEDDHMKDFIFNARKAMGGKDGLEPDGDILRQLVSELDEIELSEIRSNPHSNNGTIILARNNLQVNQIGDWCERNGVPYKIHRGTQGDYWPGWIARLVQGVDNGQMSYDIAAMRWERRLGNSRIHFDEAWRFLDDNGIVRSDWIDLSILNQKVRERSPRYGDSDDNVNTLLISTIHRSKGLEYNTVILLKPESHYNTSTDSRERETSVIYVAATRAKRQLIILNENNNVLRRGAKKDFDVKQKLKHFLVRSNSNRWLKHMLLYGIDELAQESLIQTELFKPTSNGKDYVKKCQEKLWEAYGEWLGEMNISSLSDNFVFTIPKGIAGLNKDFPFCRASKNLEWDLKMLDDKYKHYLERSVKGLSNIQVVDLATIGFHTGNALANERLGYACLAIAPVVQCEAKLDITWEEQS